MWGHSTTIPINLPQFFDFYLRKNILKIGGENSVFTEEMKPKTFK